MSGSLSDDELMRRCQTGDASAFEELATRYRRRLESLASRWMEAETPPAEVAQDVLTAAYEARESYRPEGRFGSWLFALAANHLRNLARAQRRRRAALGRETPDPVDMQVPAPAGVDAIWAALGGIPPAHRAALLLHELYGFPHEEIADLFGVPAGTVRSWVSRGKQQVRQALGLGGRGKGGRGT